MPITNYEQFLAKGPPLGCPGNTPVTLCFDLDAGECQTSVLRAVLAGRAGSRAA